MNPKYKILTRCLWFSLLLVILAILFIPPIFSKIPQPGKLWVEQKKMPPVADLIIACFQDTGKMPKTILEVQDWAAKKRGWKKTDPVWSFKNPNDGKTYDWILDPKEKSFVLQSPHFKVGDKESWIEYNGLDDYVHLKRVK